MIIQGLVFWHPVRAGRPTALSGQTMTFKMLTPVTPGWASSRVRDRISGVGSFLQPTSLASLAKFSFVAVREVCFEAKNSRGLKEHRFSTQRAVKGQKFWSSNQRVSQLNGSLNKRKPWSACVWRLWKVPCWCWEKLIAPLQTFYSAGQVCIFKTKSMWLSTCWRLLSHWFFNSSWYFTILRLLP